MKSLQQTTSNTLGLISKFSLVSLLVTSTQTALSQTPVDATDGIDFGNGPNDPAMGKEPSTSNLNVGVAAGSVFKIFASTASPTFIAGEGHEATVTQGKWYRIAYGQARANAQITLRDNTSGGGHSTLVLRAGMSYGDHKRMSVNVLSHTGYNKTMFPEVRILERQTGSSSDQLYKPFYLEVKVDPYRATGPARFTIEDNLSNPGWIGIDWQEVDELPEGYGARNYSTDTLFGIGDYQNRFTVSRGGEVNVTGNLKVNGSPAITQMSAQYVLASQFLSKNSVNPSSRINGIAAGTSPETPVPGSISVVGSGRTLGGNFDPKKAFFKLKDPSMGMSLLMDPNQFWASHDFHFQGSKAFIFSSPELRVGRDPGSNTKLTVNGPMEVAGNANFTGDVTIDGGEVLTTYNLSTKTGVFADPSWGGVSWGGGFVNNYHGAAWGRNTEAAGIGSTAFGQGTFAWGENSLAIGQYNELDSEALFTVGNGSGEGANLKSNAFVVRENGDVILGKAQGDIPMGVYGAE